MKRQWAHAWVLAATGATALGQGAPSSQPAADRSSPRAALLTVYTAMRGGDLQTVKTSMIFDHADGDGGAAEVFDVSVAQVCAPLRLMHAMQMRFGDAALKPFDLSVLKSIDEAIAHIKQAEIAVTGDTAVVAQKKASINPDAETELSGLTLKKIGPDWKIIASTFPESGGEMSPKQLSLMRSIRDAMDAACQTTIARLDHGDFHSADEAYAAYQALLQPSANAAGKASTPATAK